MTHSNHSTALACATLATASQTASVTSASIAANAFTVTTAGNIYSNLTFTQPATMSILGEDPKIVTAKGEIDLDHLVDFMKRAEEILCVVKANQERLERYPALQEAYDHYRIIDALCRDDEDDG